VQPALKISIFTIFYIIFATLTLQATPAGLARDQRQG
jgi:hypothetical protein